VIGPLAELERAVVFENGETLDFRHLEGTGGPVGAVGVEGEDWFNERFVIPSEGFSIEDAMMRFIRHALNQTGDNMSAAARLLGVPRDYLRYRLERRERGAPASTATANEV
jgi:DNA-binding NtrC family response regulator